MGPVIDKDGFDRQIEITYQKLEGLLQRMSSSGEEASIANEALEELSTTLEELHVASEELSRQNMELAKAQLAAQAERQRYQDLFDFAPDGYLVTDTNGVIREANKAAADLLHVAQDRLVGKPLAVYVTEAERKAFRDILSTLLKRAITGANEWEIGLRPRVGRELRASITVTPVVPFAVPQQPAGKETTEGVGLRWSLRDITESKRAEERERLLEKSQRATQEALQAREALQVSEERYRALIENSPDLITRFDREMRLVFANPATLQRTGKPADALMGRTAQEYGAAQASASIWEQNFKQVLETGKTQRFDNSSLYQGEVRLYDILAVPEFAEDGSVGMVMVIARDITEKRQAEEALRMNEADLRGILNATIESIWMFDAEGTILMANETALKRFKHPAEEVMGQPFSKFVPAELAQSRQASLQKVVESGQPVESEDEHAGIVFHHTFYPVKDSDRHVVRIVAFSQDITERKRAEETLRESEERYKKLVQYAPAAIYEMDLQGTKFLSVNDVLCDILKYSREELLSTKPIDLLDQESQASFKDRMRKKLAGEQIDESVEYRIRRKDGEWIDTVVNVGAITYKDEIPNRVVVIGYDVTERKKIEQALRDSEEKYRSLVKFAPAGIYTVDFRTGRFTEVNDAMCQILGYTREELLGMTAFNILDEAGQAAFASRIRQAQAGDAPSPATEYRVRAKDGRVIWGLLNVTFHREGGKIVRATVIANDISERRQAEEALRESEERFKGLVKYAPAAIYEMNLQGTKFLSVNDVLCELLKYPREELLSMRPIDLLDKESQVLFKERINRKLAGEQIDESIEYRVRRKDGEWIDTIVNVGAITFTDEKPSQVVVIGYDVTERKRMEQAFRESEARLRRVFESGLLGIIYWNMAGEIMDANDKFLEMTGFTREDLNTGKIDWTRMTPPEYWHLDEASMAELKATGVNATPFEKEYIRKDGRRLPVLVAGAMLDEARSSGVAFVLDITGRKQAEEKMRASNEELRRFNKAMVGREMRMVELKNEINELCRRAGLPERYGKDTGALKNEDGQR